MALLLVKGDEPTPPVGGVTFFEESFASDKGTFTIEDKTRPTKVSEIWKWSLIHRRLAELPANI